MWLMLQQDEPDDYVIATGEMHSVRELCEVAFGLVGLDWEEHVRIDERYFRPTEVDELCGDASKARARPRLESRRPRFRELVRIMLEADLREAGLDPTAHHAAARGRRDDRSGRTAGSWSPAAPGSSARRVVRRLRGGGADDIFVPRSARLRPADARRRRARARRRRGPTSSSTSPPSSAASAPTARTRAASSTRTRSWASQLMEQARLRGVAKFVPIGTVCSYPKFTPVPVPRGRPLERLPGGDERAVRPRQEDAARPGPGLPPAVRLQRHPPDPGQPLRPGRQLRSRQLARHPGADQEVRRRPRRADDYIEVWGTGSASREFLYVDDAAEGIVLAAERYDGPEPVNLGVGHEITIRDLVELIAELTGFTGEIRWDATKPDGQPRRALDTSRARERFGFVATTSFEDGLRRTIDWYEAAAIPTPS